MAKRELGKKLGEILLGQGKINSDELEKALQEQQKDGNNRQRIGNYLINLSNVNEEDIAYALGIQFNLPVMHLTDLRIKPEVIDLVSENMARKFNIIPLFKVENELTLAVSDPTDFNLLDIVGSETGCKVVPVIAPYSEISKAVDKQYQKIEANVTDVESELTTISSSEIDELRKSGDELSVVKIVDRTIMQAVEDEASDIHIEPRKEKLTIRFRIDGIMLEHATHPIKMHQGIVSRTKILSSLNIAERQKPQDGRLHVKIDNKNIDIRVSTLPTYYGEKVVLRLLIRESVKVRVENLGFSERILNTFQKLIKEPYGMIIVTGPTGSGKTTTLYAALNEINSVEKNIITVEDPIEYQLPIINQVQLNPKKDLTFTNALRTILRQDPDIIMIGEIRDPETASIAAESALTGHLVFSTLHTNDAISSLTRLLDMGVEPFLLAPSLLCVLAQRLVRKICPRCKKEYQPSKAELSTVGLDPSIKDITFYKGMGCNYCRHTKYKGRAGIHELLVVDEKIRELIINKPSLNTIRREADRNGFKDLRFDGLKKVISGITSIEELLRVTRNRS